MRNLYKNILWGNGLERGAMETIIGLGGGPWPTFKRYLMERPTHGFPEPIFNHSFQLRRYQPEDLHDHAEALAKAFSDSDDRMLFPVLGSKEGCLELMREIVRRWDFVPEATWLAIGAAGPVGTIQGLKSGSTGMIQNVGVIPEARCRGLGKLLLKNAIDGYSETGIGTVQLEVTANNIPAVTLYELMGFHRTKVLYKPATTILI